MASEFKKQIEEWMKRREEKNRPEIKDTTHSTDPGRLIPEEREEEDHNFYSRKIKEYALRRADELAVNKSEELDKGVKGDWQKEGYTITHKTDDSTHPWTDHFIEAYSPDGKKIGRTMVSMGEYSSGTQEAPHGTWVHPDHRRKGIASAMYQYAEKKLGCHLIPDDGHSKDAEALWSQPNRPFGKEELDKGAKGDWQKEGYSLKYLGSETEYNKKQPDFTVHTIKAYDNNGNEAGTYDFVEHHASKQYQGQIFPNNVHTKEKHQRKGLANAAYKMLEDITDKKLSRPVGEGSQSDSAKTLWSQPNKPFGGKNEVK